MCKLNIQTSLEVICPFHSSVSVAQALLLFTRGGPFALHLSPRIRRLDEQMTGAWLPLLSELQFLARWYGMRAK